MRYSDCGSEVRVGDRVLVEGEVAGIVICDFNKKLCLPGHEAWLSDQGMVGGGRLDDGLMVRTEKFGDVHYTDPCERIVKAAETSLDVPRLLWLEP